MMEKKELLPLQVECTVLFQSEPHMQATGEMIAERLNAKIEVINNILNTLLKQGIIQQSGEHPSPVYRYNEPVTTDEINLTKENDCL